MRQVFVCFLAFGLTAVVSGNEFFDNVGSETKEIVSKDTSTSSISFLDKNKRGAAKITSSDTPGFNHLGSNSVTSTSTSGSSSGFKPSASVGSNAPPYKFLYNNQYYQTYQPHPYLTFVQIPHAAQIAAQYAIQTNPVTHYLQTPTQIQYVSTPAVANIPQLQYQTFSSDFPAASTSSKIGLLSGGASSQYATTQQAFGPPSQPYVSSGQTSSSSPSAAASQNKQIQVPLYSNYPTTQSVHYQQQQAQQPFFTFIMQPHIAPTNFLYQQPAANFLIKQQQLLNLFGGNRFGLYNSGQTGQLGYYVPIAVSPSIQESPKASSDAKKSDKTPSTSQNSASSSSFTYGTKA